MRNYYSFLLGVCFLLPGMVFADTSTGNSGTAPTSVVPAANADLPTHPPTPQYTIGSFNVNGYVEASYNHLSQSQFFTSGTTSREYDIDPNGFTLNQAALTISDQPTQGLGGLLNVFLGRDTYATATYGMQPWFDSQNLGFTIPQLFLQYAVKSFTFIGGKFYSLAGYESIAPPQNTNFSNSLISTFAEPTAVTGVRATYAVNDKINLVAGVNDGWDNIRDWGRRKTIELGAAYTDPTYTFSAYWYNGVERSAAAFPVTNLGPTGERNLLDLIASMNVTDKLTLVANYDYVTQDRALLPSGLLGRAVWQGIAGYVQYQFNEKWRTSIRGEYFNDRNGFSTGVPQSLKELTLTVGYLVFKHFELRAEARHDVSNTNAFLAKNGVSTGNNLQSYALAGIFTF